MLASRHQNDELPYINMTPMVDVVLCLLIFFMVATRLYDWDENQFTVRVPEVAKASPLTSAPEDLTLEVAGPGRVTVGDTTYNLDSLTAMLKAARERYPKQGVLVRGDARLSYQDVADVLAACEAAGIRSVRLPVRPRPEPEQTSQRRDDGSPRHDRPENLSTGV